MTKKKDTALNFEDSLASLEDIVSAMEEGELSLEDSLQAFEQGIKLTRECQKALETAEQKVQVLMSSNDTDGQPQLAPMEDGADSNH
jgi:exodeoxyribonuclease VII small subunit